MKVVVVILFFLMQNIYAEDLVEYDYELDAYYTNVSAFIDIDRDKNITDGSNMTEVELYKSLFFGSLSPNIFLLEASLHPMGIAGLYYRKLNENQYTTESLQNFNLVKTLTAGYEEPYSLSMFIGRMIVFKKKNTTRVGNNRAYTGFLFSIGDKTIKDNRSYDDTWINIEFKLKGTRDKENADLDWSFRVGSRVHKKGDFVDSLYIGARRKSIDYDKSVLSIIHNSAFSFMFAVNSDTFEIIETEILLEKVYPSAIKGLSLSFGVGYLFTSDNKYLGILRDDGVDNHKLIFRPNFKYKF